MKQQGSPFGKRELSQPPLDAAPAGLCPAGWGSAGPVLGEKLSLSLREMLSRGRAGQAALCSVAPGTQISWLDVWVRAPTRVVRCN